ncbi:protein SIEVE ELEMENT OCCLUSION B-like isoform X1 [Ziziphus jujuba]|uniref:Protein SIEVE ELEMENT OCCLUSION B-like isoform X1 n=1 Tax=Ziziphus jujuba TaxID=326968 RepID=A0A6P3ZMH9_ZIZJJ|nr:protein SIEVE ELEMENT OCCLUSION B-like isoform X1 [Ziziphus jujuba]
MSDPTLESIVATHGHVDNSFNIAVHPLLEIVQSIINRSTYVVERNVVYGNMKVEEETVDHMFKSPNINLPFCTLKAISCELSIGSCKLAGEVREDVARELTLSILKKLSNCSWDAKAVLTVAAFALDYGEFWHLVEPHQSDHLARPLAILKGASVLLKKPAELQKGRQTIAEFNRLIKRTLQVILLIYELETLSRSYSSKDVPELAIASELIPVAVYWVIRTTLACTTNIAIFISKDHEDKSAGDLDLLVSSVQKINRMADDLNFHISNCKKQIVPIDTHVLLVKLFHRTPFRINEVLKAMIFGNNIERIKKYEAQTYEALINIAEGLEGKKVLWFFSNVDVSDDFITKVIIPNGEKIKKEIIEQYQIVWIPIVYEWTNEAKVKFNQLVKNKPWFPVQYFSLIAGISFIKIEWQFKNKPMVVVTSSQGKVEYRNNALAVVDQISIWDYIIPQLDPTYPEWFRPFEKYMIDIDKDITSTWIKEGKCIFFYGGKDSVWIKEFEEKATKIIEEAKAEIKLVCLNKISSKLAGQFWSTVENLFLSLIKMDINNQQANERAIREVRKLISYRNEKGWAILFKGLNVVTSGYGTTISKVFDDFEKWRDQLTNDSKFEDIFEKYHDKVVKENSKVCYRFEIENGSEKEIPHHALQCPSCSRAMRRFLSFNCCHEDNVE